MRGKWKKRLFTVVTAMMAGLLMSHGLPQLAADLNSVMVFADGTNTVTFTSAVAQANESNLIFADIEAYGNPGETLLVTYRTSSATAIEGIDYDGVYNSIEMKIDESGGAKYRVSIKCKNDASTREKLRVYEGDKDYGRYFNLDLIPPSNATLGQNGRCKCYTAYDYRVSATTGGYDGILGKEIAFLDDYKDMIAKYHKGDNDISGRENWRTWKEGVSFNNDKTKRWINTYINPGFASAYGSYVLKNIDDDKLHSTTNIHMLSGNKEFMDKYSRDSDCPGLSLYYQIEPCKSGGHRIDGNAMYYISENINPHKKQDALVDLVDMDYRSPDRLRLYWIQKEDTWYSSANSIYNSVFYKTDPYGGILDYGLSIYNGNKSWDREVHDIWMFLTLVDNKAPTVIGQYCEYNPVSETIRIYLRFNEPVYSSKKHDLLVRLNNYSTNYSARYVEGNYSDTLVYEIPANPALNIKITSLQYELPTEDIGDMAYLLRNNKLIENNLVQNTDMRRAATITTGAIDLCRPQVGVDIQSSLKPNAVYNIMISANGNGQTTFDTGVVYYTFDKNEALQDYLNPAVYENSHVLTSEEYGSFAVTLAKDESKGIDSGLYYLHALVVSQYGMKAAGTFGSYKLDGDAPKIEQLDPSVDVLRKKVYQLKIENKSLGTDIKTANAIVKYADTNNNNVTASLPLIVNGELNSSLGSIVARNYDTGFSILEYRSNIDETDLSVPQDQFMLNLLGERSRLPVEISFDVEDDAGNKATSASFRTVYDKRALFENVITSPASYSKDSSIDVGSDVFDISNAAENAGISFALSDDNDKALIDEGAVYKVTVNGEKDFVADSYSVTLSGLDAGYYEAVATISGTAGSTEVDMVSKAYSFYLTNGMNDDTINKSVAYGNLVLSNRVFQLQDARFYYFRSQDSSAASFMYGATYNPSSEKYEGGAAYPTFSSTVEAKKYVKYMEYQDLELVQISDTIASLLNSSTSTVYVKAAKETQNAMEGQLWIRYKKSTWTSATGPSGWAFYFYGNGKLENGININGLSNNLSSAMDAVTNRIIGEGKEVYLVGEDNTSRLSGAPSLSQSQMHVDRETAESTISGNNFVTNPVYVGDANLYQNNIKIDADNYPLATNLQLSIGASSILYFKHYGASSWTKLDVEDGALLKNALSEQPSGLYTIREYGDAGICEFTVYIDRGLPQLSVTLNKGLANETDIVLDGSITTINAKSVTLNELIGEIDPQAFVAIYSYPARSLQTVLYGSNINDFSLTGGNYFLQVGDRSGNVVTYTVWTSDSQIELSVAENEAKTAVIVKVENRDDSEIYSYEVYLNEVIIDSEYSSYKIFRQAGIYRIEVVDIYGNRATSTITHENPSPELTWYYINDAGSYSPYDENRPVKMVLEDDPSSSRTTNVHASTTVRVMFDLSYENDTVEYEILDIEKSDYEYSEQRGMGVITFRTLSSWRMRIWYHNQPENDHLYVFSVDADAPEINATFIGSGFHPYVVYDDNDNIVITSTFDSLNYDNYEEGDVAFLDTLAYETSGQATITFHSGNVISGKHISLKLSDRSGIRSVTVLRNGVQVEAELSSENELILNGYGTYQITIVDNLGNTATFIFTNVESDISSATIDDQELVQDELVYGHNCVDVTTLYDGTTTILVRDGDRIFTYEFHYENGVLTYGQYIIGVETYQEGEETVESKFADYVQATGFSLDASNDSIIRNNYYPAIEYPDFSIYAMIDSEGRAHYRVATNGPEIYAEARFFVGSVHLPNRYIADLSNESPSLVLLTGGKEVEKVASLNYIFIADTLTIDKDAVSENITKIEYCYSETTSFGQMKTLYKDGQWIEDLVGEAYGYYQIEVTNKFGNKTAYLVSKIEAFASIVNIHYLDGSTITLRNNEGTIYSNYSIELVVFSTEVNFEVNGVVTGGFVETGSTSITLSRDGQYHVRVISANGVAEEFDFEIFADETFLYDESWITGYNEDALLHDQGYTNSTCTVNLEEEVVFVEMTVNDENLYVLYDNISDEKKIEPGLLVDAIGRYGVGKYVVGFRNKYGDLASKTVYYNNIPSIVLTRSTLSDPNARQVYDLGLAVSKGFYSNHVLYFSTTSSTYIFTIDGVEYRLDEPKDIPFSNISGKGYFSYRVTYLDEYGNYVKFDAILLREEVEFDTSSMKLMTVNNVLYTRDDVSITFGEDLKATLSINGGEAKDYKSGEMHFADGEYYFVVRDIAGNNVSFSIVHKSVNHYSLTVSSTGEDVIDGGVVNDSNVIFQATEGSRIKYVVRNGELIEDFAATTFTQTGHYEVIIEDQIGNMSYEEFTILNNDLSTFDYKAPFEYEVTEVWRINPDGERELVEGLKGEKIHLDRNGDYLVVVTSTKTASSFNFSVGIDNTPPTAKLVGVDDGGVTGREVSLTGLRMGDVIKIYKDGELLSTTTVSISTESPKITTGGRYLISITNVQGVEVTYSFTRKAIANVPGSIVVIAFSIIAITAVGIGLFYHTKLKTDD